MTGGSKESVICPVTGMTCENELCIEAHNLEKNQPCRDVVKGLELLFAGEALLRRQLGEQETELLRLMRYPLLVVAARRFGIHEMLLSKQVLKGLNGKSNHLKTALKSIEGDL